jgi:hypothetical protein
LHLLEVDPDFRDYLTELLATSEYVAYRWETPPVTTNSIDRPFEFVLNGYSSLKVRPDPGVFDPYFKEADSATEDRLADSRVLADLPDWSSFNGSCTHRTVGSRPARVSLCSHCINEFFFVHGL